MKKALLALLLVAACSDSSGVSIKDFPNQLLKAICKNAVTCQQFPDEATCESSEVVNNTFLMTMSAAVNSKQVKYDSGLAQKCLDQISSQGCAFTGFGLNKPTDPCVAMFTGLVPTAGACFASGECAANGLCVPTSSTCDPTTTCCPGTCMAAPALVAIGGACQATSDCVKGAYCAQTSGQCTALVATAGSPCDGIDGCADPMVCNFDFTMNKFTTCYTPAARAATCDTNNFFPCADERDYCDTTTNKCTQDVATGQACNGANGALCVGYDECNASSMCTARPGVSGACMVDMFGFSDCLGNLACTNSTCQKPTALSCM